MSVNSLSMMRPFVLFLIAILSLQGCAVHKKTDYLLRERNLIPEGIAFDNRTKTIYVGSTHKRKIVQIGKNGIVSDFTPQKFENLASPVGMEVDENRGVLWSCVAHANKVMPLIDPHPTDDGFSSIVSYDINSGKLIKQYNLAEEGTFLNDLTILPNGDVYITESVNNKIYRIDPQSDSLQLFLAINGFSFLNGIEASEKSNALFVASEEGIIKIDIPTKIYAVLPTPDSIQAKGIDGLTLYGNKLIGHQSSRITLFTMNETETEIIGKSILDKGPEFDSSTTGEIGGRYYYYIVNSQIRSGIDKATGNIKPESELKDVIIRRIRL